MAARTGHFSLIAAAAEFEMNCYYESTVEALACKPASARRMHKILIVEDNPSDIELLRYFMKSDPALVKLEIAHDGVEALRMLRGEPPYQTPIHPELILLDLNLPRKDGREVLEELKKDPQLKHIPVIVLSTSDATRDVMGAYQLHANCYLQKPANADEYERTVRGIEEFWLSLAKLPPVVPTAI